MNAGIIWWGQIGNSLRLLTRVTNTLRDCRSALVRLPRQLPWRYDFYEAVDIRRSGFSAQRRLVRLPWEADADPGAFILEQLCSQRVRAEYWPGQTYAAYLGARGDILLSDYDVWVTGVHSKADAAAWAAFAAGYERAARALDHHAVFLIEYDGPAVDLHGLNEIAYTVENYDCRVFCLEDAAACGNTRLQTYQAELALSLGNDDPMLCHALIAAGEQLLREPVRTAAQVLAVLGCDAPGEQALVSAVWKAAVLLLFPILEQHRMAFIAQHHDALVRYLPACKTYGHRIQDPCDMELGALYHVVTSSGAPFTPEETENVMLWRRVRNDLAHIRAVPYEDVCRLLCQ